MQISSDFAVDGKYFFCPVAKKKMKVVEISKEVDHMNGKLK